MTYDNECPVCYEVKDLEKLTCNHSICFDCANTIIDTQVNNNLSCPMCRNISYEIDNNEINTKIRNIELNKKNDDDEDFTYRSTIIINKYVNEYFKKKLPFTRINPKKKFTIRNNNVVKDTYS